MKIDPRLLTFGALSLAGLLAGCGDGFSNRPFEEDALFLAALPDAEQLEVRMPDENDAHARPTACAAGESSSCDPDLYRQYSLSVAREVNGFTMNILEALDEIRAHNPTTRTADSRVWGPWQLSSGAWGRLEVTREGANFTYDLTLAETLDGPWSVLLDGYFVPGSTADEGQGAFVFDFAVEEAFRSDGGLVAGRADVVYSTLGDGLELSLEALDLIRVDDPTPRDNLYQYQAPGDGAGCFFHQKEDPVFTYEGNEADALELTTIWSCWDETGRGRADVRVSGGDMAEVTGELEDPTLKGVECWNVAQTPTYFASYVDETRVVCPAQGDPASCAAPVIGWNGE